MSKKERKAAEKASYLSGFDKENLYFSNNASVKSEFGEDSNRFLHVEVNNLDLLYFQIWNFSLIIRTSVQLFIGHGLVIISSCFSLYIISGHYPTKINFIAI